MVNESRKELNKAQKLYKDDKNYTEVLKIYEKYYKDDSKLLNIWDRRFFSWSLYHLYIKEFESEEELFENVSLVTELLEQDDLNKSQTCAYTLSVVKVLDYLYKKNDWEYLIVWLEKLDPKLLDDNKIEFNETKYPSRREKYYNYASKAYFETMDYEECITVSKEALESLKSFVNFSDTWYKFRIAKSLKELGEYDEALVYLEEVNKVKKDWFIDLQFAETYYFKEDENNALKYTIEAALKPETVDSKINLYSFLKDIIYDEYPNEALKHEYLIYTIRLSKGWPIDDNLKEKIENSEFDETNKDYRKVESELKTFWNDLKYKDKEQKTGIISKILSHGNSGFINGEDGVGYFFSIYDFKDNKSELSEYKSVTFYSEKSFDKSKNRESMKAVNIHLLK